MKKEGQKFYLKNFNFLIAVLFVSLFFIGVKFTEAKIITQSFYSNSNDGFVYFTDSNWDITHDKGEGIVEDGYLRAYTGKSSTNRFGIDRSFIPFDTSDIPDSAVIKSAKLFLFAYKKEKDTDSGNEWITVVKTTQANPLNNLIEDDYDQCGAINSPTEGVDPEDRKKISDITVGEYHYLNLNSTGFEWIDKVNSLSDDNTKGTLLGVREGHDVVDVPITGGAYTYNFVEYYSSESGSSTAPYLEITYEVPDVPVIIVPGIMGSYLFDGDNNEVWINAWKMTDSGSDVYLLKLLMDEDGNALNKMEAVDVIRKVAGSVDFYQGLIAHLESEGYVEGKDLFVFPYDWRLDIGSVAGVDDSPGDNTLKNKIAQVLADSPSTKVDLIAHSMGGLVVKKYLADFGTSSVNKFIDIATPHYGAPLAYKVLLYGDNMGINLGNSSFLNEATVWTIAQNMPSIYDLLPSIKYIDPGDHNYNSFFYDFVDLDNNGITKKLDYFESKQFLINLGKNTSLINSAEGLHNQIDDFVYDNAYNIAGCGKATIGKIIAKNWGHNPEGYEYALKYVDGDGTVPLRSATDFNAPLLYSNEAKHSQLSSTPGTVNFVSAVLKDELSEFSADDYTGLSTDDSICGFSGNVISFHSPIELHAYDQALNHTGPINDGDIEYGIKDSTYDVISGNKFAFLPAGQVYDIVGDATGQGSCDIRVQRIVNTKYMGLVYFNDVPLLSADTIIKFRVGDDDDSIVLSVDNNGDGVVDEEISPSAVLNPEEADDWVKPVTDIAINGAQASGGDYLSPVEVSFTATDDNSGVLKTEYSLDDGSTWNLYSAPFAIDQLGAHKIKYYSIDRTGNMENIKETIVNIIEETEETDFDLVRTNINDLYKGGGIVMHHVRKLLLARVNLLEKIYNRYQNEKKQWKKFLLKKQYNFFIRITEIKLKFYLRREWVTKGAYGNLYDDFNFLKGLI